MSHNTTTLINIIIEWPHQPLLWGGETLNYVKNYLDYPNDMCQKWGLKNGVVQKLRWEGGGVMGRTPCTFLLFEIAF